MDNILKMTFDQWLADRYGYDAAGYMAILEKSYQYSPSPRYTPEKVMSSMREEYRHEIDCYAAIPLELTFVEWLRIYERHTMESFHDMCAATGITPKEEGLALDYLRVKYEIHQINAGCPF